MRRSGYIVDAVIRHFFRYAGAVPLYSYSQHESFGVFRIKLISLLKDRRKRLTIILYLISMHSFLVGLGLMIQWAPMMDWAGFGTIAQPFFAAQGGVFHILMAVLYILGGRLPRHQAILIPFILSVKTTATIFLLLYYLTVEPIKMVLLSGLSDGAMAVLIGLAWLSFPQEQQQEN